MDKNNVKAMFEKMRQEKPEMIQKPITDYPAQPGNYNVEIKGVKTLMPMFAKFDGEKWDLKEAQLWSGGDLSRITYWDKVSNDKKLKM